MLWMPIAVVAVLLGLLSTAVAALLAWRLHQSGYQW